MRNIEVIKTDKKGLIAFYKEYYLLTYAKRQWKLTNKEATQKALKIVEDVHNNNCNIYDFEYNGIFTKNEVLNILKKAKAKIEIETTQTTNI
jgi:hypothetical protein